MFDLDFWAKQSIIPYKLFAGERRLFRWHFQICSQILSLMSKIRKFSNQFPPNNILELYALPALLSGLFRTSGPWCLVWCDFAETVVVCKCLPNRSSQGKAPCCLPNAKVSAQWWKPSTGALSGWRWTACSSPTETWAEALFPLSSLFVVCPGGHEKQLPWLNVFQSRLPSASTASIPPVPCRRGGQQTQGPHAAGVLIHCPCNQHHLYLQACSIVRFKRAWTIAWVFLVKRNASSKCYTNHCKSLRKSLWLLRVPHV